MKHYRLIRRSADELRVDPSQACQGRPLCYEPAIVRAYSPDATSPTGRRCRNLCEHCARAFSARYSCELPSRADQREEVSP